MRAALSVESMNLEAPTFGNGEPVFTIVAELPSGLTMRLYEAGHIHISILRLNTEPFYRVKVPL